MARSLSTPRSRQNVRIIGGRWRGLRLPIAPVPGLRPTPDRVRETLFNWLQPTIAGAECLDLFAGTGALGLEALSRGAARVTLVERNGAAAAAIRRAITDLRAEGASLVQADAIRYLAANGAPQDLIFVDPPFASALMESSLRLLTAQALLRSGARLYLEVDARRTPLVLPDDWHIDRQGRAGEVAFCLIRVAAAEGRRSCSSPPCWP